MRARQLIQEILAKGRFALKTQDGKFVTQKGHRPYLTDNQHLVYLWDSADQAEIRRASYEKALGVSLQVAPFSYDKPIDIHPPHYQ